MLMFIYLLFLTETFLSNYVDDNSLFKVGRDLEFVKKILRKDFKTTTDSIKITWY